MKRLLAILFLITAVKVNAQNDTLRFNGMFNLQGRHQSGNLNQFGGLALLKTSLSNTKFYTGVSVSYNYVEVEDFNAVNDFWSNGLVKYNHKKTIYPLAMIYAGFAKSFGIDEAYVEGIGVGVNVVQKSPTKYLNINVIGGYSTFNYTQVSNVSDFVTNIYVSSNTSLFKTKVEINWEFHGFYFPNTEFDVSGLQNNVRLSLPLTKAIRFTLTHQYLYNSYVDVAISKENSMLLFGLMIRK